ncbi:MAG: efflux RND transporter periplasmic adaptor subunit [Candidatus Yanofskybacteria bacterium]|nr:efflux RND transporter periplasmic adaptor subunit [Candidatus Yanofskybacteria bacterium]
MAYAQFQKAREFVFSRKKVFIPAAIIIVVAAFFIFGGREKSATSTETVKYADLSRRIRATGVVVSNTNLDLSFNKSSTVKSVRVEVGDKVKSGQILATLDQGSAFAALTEARAALLGATAKYEKILEGATSEEIALAEVALKNAETDLESKKSTQAVLVTNARQDLLNSTIAAVPFSGSSSVTPPTITGTYDLGKEGDIRITTYQGGSSYFNVSGLISATGIASTTTPQPIGDTGLFIQFSDVSGGDWLISIPNKKASDYLTNYNAYQSALQNERSVVESAVSLVSQRQAELNLKKAAARKADIDIAQAEILSAQGALERAQSAYEDTVIRAPASGTITKVDIKYGELTDAGKAVITIEDVENLYIEALINESNIAYLEGGQEVEVTFDAFGREKKFKGNIAHIDPSAESNEGVVNYKIKVTLVGGDVTIRPGMNVNIDILAGQRKNVLVVPSIAVKKKNGSAFVNTYSSDGKNQEEKEVQIGFTGDSNLVEVISGLKEGESVILLK